MPDPADRSPSPPWFARGAMLSFALYLALLVAATWIVVRFVLRIQLTTLLSRAITITGAEWIMYLLIGLSVISVGVTFERWLFYRKRTVDVEPARRALRELLETGRADETRRFAAELPGMEGRVTVACLERMDHGPAAMDEELQGALGQERLLYDRNLVILGTLGNNAPFVGLFGTVLGIIKAFMNLAEDISGGAAAVMAGISEALVATAIGLLVAIPSVVAYNTLKGRVRAIAANAEYLARAVVSHAQARPETAATEESDAV